MWYERHKLKVSAASSGDEPLSRIKKNYKGQLKKLTSVELKVLGLLATGFRVGLEGMALDWLTCTRGNVIDLIAWLIL